MTRINQNISKYHCPLMSIARISMEHCTVQLNCFFARRHGKGVLLKRVLILSAPETHALLWCSATILYQLIAAPHMLVCTCFLWVSMHFATFQRIQLKYNRFRVFSCIARFESKDCCMVCFGHSMAQTVWPFVGEICNSSTRCFLDEWRGENLQ